MVRDVAALGAREVPAAAMEGRVVLVVVAGGIVDVLRPAAVLLGAMLGRDLAATPDIGLFEAAGGVAVLEVDELDAPVKPSCLVGDLVGDRRPLATLGAGVGVLGTALARRAPWMLFGRGLMVLARFGCSRTCAIPVERQKMPYNGAHLKYRCPWTEPSFFPDGSSSSTPTQSPVWKEVVPMNRMKPMRSSLRAIFCPRHSSGVLIW